MNLIRHYRSLSQCIAALFFIFAVAHPCLQAQEYGKQSLFNDFTDDHFAFDRLGGNDDDDSDSESDETEYDISNSPKREHAGKETENQTKQLNPPPAPPAAHLFFFRYMQSLHQGAHFSAAVKGLEYIGCLQLASPLRAPYFEVAVKNFGVGLYPLAALQSVFPEKNIPTLFLGMGCLTFGNFLKTANFIGFAKLKPSYKGIAFPRKNFIGMGSAQKDVQYGIELYGEQWFGAFFASPESTRQRMRYGILGGWRMKQDTDIKLNFRYLTAFIPELTGEVKPSGKFTNDQSVSSESGPAQYRYHKLFGLNVIFMHPLISFETTGLCSYTADKIVSGGAQAECDLFYRYAGINAGVNYVGTSAVGWDGHQQNRQITAFAQPYFKADLFSLRTFYALNMEEKNKTHKSGVIMQVKHDIIRWTAGWDYRKDIHTAKTELTCVGSPAWFKGEQWFEKASAGVSFALQHRELNPFILKKYTVHASGEFRITDGVFCGINESLSQSVRSVTSADREEAIAYLQNPVCSSAMFLRVKRNGIGKVHSGKLELSIKNEKPYFDVKIGYQIHGK